MTPDQRAAQDYKDAKAAYEQATVRIRETRAALNAIIVVRRKDGESNKVIAAALGLTEQFINQSFVKSLGPRRRQTAAEFWAKHDAAATTSAG
jgi:hypothetical protein